MSIADQVRRINTLVHASTGSLESKTNEMGITSKGADLETINNAIQAIPIKSVSDINDTTPDAGDVVTIPAGYYKTSFNITATELSVQTQGTAASNEILSGETAWVNGQKVTGSIQSYGGQTVTPTDQRQTLSISGKYNTGNVVIEPVNYYYTGSTVPGDSEHNNGDIFLVI